MENYSLISRKSENSAGGGRKDRIAPIVRYGSNNAGTAGQKIARWGSQGQNLAGATRAKAGYRSCRGPGGCSCKVQSSQTWRMDIEEPLVNQSRGARQESTAFRLKCGGRVVYWICSIEERGAQQDKITMDPISGSKVVICVASPG